MLTRSETDAVEIRYLRYAIASAEHRSFRRAAEALRIRQSTLSRRIRDMELRLGVKLFARSRAGVRPTDAAAPFLRSASALVESIEVMTEAVKAAGRGDRGRLKLGVSVSPSAGAFQQLVLAFRAACPDVEIQICDGAAPELHHRLDIGAVDLVILPGEPGPDSCGSLSLWSERMHVALPEAHRLGAKAALAWVDLREETFLIGEPPDATSGVSAAALTKLQGAGGVRLCQHRVSPGQLISLVACGLGFAVLSEANAGLVCQGVVYRPIVDGRVAAQFGYAAHWRPERVSPVLARFLQLLHQEYPPADAVRAQAGGGD